MKKERQNQKQNKKQNLKAYKGITLIALVVTIVVLLILAAISITALFGDNGLITRANNAKTKTDEGAESDINAIENLNSRINEIVNGTTVGDFEEDPTTPPTVTPTSTIDALKANASDKNEIVLDKYKNKIVVPAGFKIVQHGNKEYDNNMVEYTYDKVGGISTHTPVVQDGIVIKNETDGNEFVWVPVGEIKNDAEENTENTTTITLGRYENFTVAEAGTLPTPVQVASKTAYDTPTPIGNRHKRIEISSNFARTTIGSTTYNAASSYGNTKAYNLQEWISTTIDNGGYYIARYEASKNGEKATSKVSTGTASSSSEVTDGMLWNNIAQPDAAKASKAMYPYSAEAKYYSDLINSYAWDTAIIFIEAYSGDTTYASKKGIEINADIANAGVNADKRCNIQDMAGNVAEWTTETNTYSGIPSTHRGGCYGRDSYVTSYRGCDNTGGHTIISFRSSLCVK